MAKNSKGVGDTAKIPQTEFTARVKRGVLRGDDAATYKVKK